MVQERRKGVLSAGMSLWALLAKSSFYKILAVLGVMALGEGLWLRNLPEREMFPESLESMIDNALPFLFLPAFGLIFFILARTQGLMGDRSQYTMQRLKTGSVQIFVIQTMYNILCISLLFSVQIFLAVWMIGIYGESLPPEALSPQLLFLAFYRSKFLHCLLPLAETGKWVRNILCILALGMGAAQEREKKKQLGQICLFIVTLSWFVTPIGLGYMDVICDIVYGVTILGTLWKKDIFQRRKSSERMETVGRA